MMQRLKLKTAEFPFKRLPSHHQPVSGLLSCWSLTPAWVAAEKLLRKHQVRFQSLSNMQNELLQMCPVIVKACGCVVEQFLTNLSSCHPSLKETESVFLYFTSLSSGPSAPGQRICFTDTDERDNPEVLASACVWPHTLIDGPPPWLPPVQVWHSYPSRHCHRTNPTSCLF